MCCYLLCWVFSLFLSFFLHWVLEDLWRCRETSGDVRPLGTSGDLGNALSHKGLLYPTPTKDYSVPLSSVLSYKGLLCPTSDWSSYKILFSPSRIWSVPYGAAMSYKGLLCPTCDMWFVCFTIDSFVLQGTALSHKWLVCLTKYFSVLQGIGLSHIGLLFPTWECSVPQSTDLPQ